MHKSKSLKTHSSIYSNSSGLNSYPQLAHRPYGSEIQKASVTAKTPTDIENEGFAEQQMQATELKLQAKFGSITPEGQERLNVLQAKMDGLLNSGLEHATRFSHNIANIPLRRPDIPTPIQAKLTIGEPGDKYEQEADETARQVVQRIHQQSNQPVQREAVTEEEELQTKTIDNIQRQKSSEEELQMQSMVQRVADGGMAASTDVEAGIQQARGGGQLLADNIREPMEQAFGADFSGVRVHTDSQADQLNQSIQAKAFTTGQDVFFRQGEYNPGSQGGQELLAHELTHVVQQSGGAVKRFPQQRQTVNSLDGSEKREGHNLEVQLEAQKSNQERLMLQAKWAGEVPLNSKDSEVKAKLIDLGYSAAANIQTWKITSLRQDKNEYVSYEKIAEALGLTTAQPPTQQNLPPTQQNLPPTQQNLPPTQQNLPPTQQNLPPTQQEDVAHSSKEANITKDKEYFSARTKLIPKTLTIKNLFRGDQRKREVLASEGFQPGKRVEGYEQKLQAFLGRSSRDESEAASRRMISRESGLDINEQGGRAKPPTDLVWSQEKIEISGGKKLTLLNYVCTGPETGAGTTSYLIAVDAEFECVAASPTIGLYQSSSGMKIIAVAQSGGTNGGYAMFTEYDFLTPISPNMIYYASNDGGVTQADNGTSWFRVSDQKQR
ncbi:DUF4157 domain-containing protein [Nostoc sp. UCD121]|uniref:eCIS core domain-containing protein n=1 Tax=Nostoc sp. UCD121 TaxID=2681305 RepID=UPI001C8913F2|nr:DUF4157 domain-containing protein [Nostoc sp. UCD121]